MTTDCDMAGVDIERDREVSMRGNGQHLGGNVSPVRRPSLASEALILIDGPRQNAYGPPADHLDKVARVWSVLLGTDLDASRVAVCLAAFKLVRESHAHYRDNLVDAVGYLELAELVADAEV